MYSTIKYVLSISHDDGIRNHNYHAPVVVAITIPGRDDCLRRAADDGATTTTTAVAVVRILVLLFLLTISALVLHPESQQ